MFQKRCTLLYEDGVLDATIAQDAFELDLPSLKRRYPSLNCVAFDFRQGEYSPWVSVGTVFLNEAAE